MRFALALLLAFAPSLVHAQALLSPQAQTESANDNSPRAASTVDRADQFLQSGTGATARRLVDKLKSLPIDVADFGAVGDGVADDTAPIMNALTEACARGGATVRLMAKHRVSATIDNTCSRVLVEGLGDDTPHDVPGTYSSKAGTLIIPTFAGTVLRHRTPTATEQGISASANSIRTGGGFKGITVIGNQIATRLLHVTSIRRGSYHLTLQDSVGGDAATFDTIADIRDTVGVPQVSEASDTSLNDINLFVRQYSDADGGVGAGNADGVVFSGNPTTLGASGNTSYNFGIQLTVQTHNGVGLRFISGDNNVFKAFRSIVSGTGKPFVVQANRAAPSGIYVNDSNVFEHYQATHAGYIEGESERVDGDATEGTTIVNLDTSNSSVVPISGGTSTLTIINANGGWRTYSPGVSSSGGVLTGYTVADARWSKINQTASFTVTWTSSFTSASGAIQFTLPVSARSPMTFTGRESFTNRAMVCSVAAGASTSACYYSDGTSPLRNGTYYNVTGSYEVQ